MNHLSSNLAVRMTTLAAAIGLAMLVAPAWTAPAGAQGATNPDLESSCGTDVVFVLDESGSIQHYDQTPAVATAVLTLANGLVNTGSHMRIVEFANTARDAVINGSTASQTVDAAFVAGLKTYLRDGASSDPLVLPSDPTTYNPNNEYFSDNDVPGNLERGTNWEAALGAAATGEPLVVFVTDGDPTNSNGYDVNPLIPTNDQPSDPAAQAAADEMAALQTTSHVLAVGVGAAITNDDSFARLRNLVEPVNPVVWDGTGDLSVPTTDAIKVPFAGLEDALRRISLGLFHLCSPTLSITKVDAAGAAVPNWSFTTTVDVANTGAGSARQLEWLSPNDGVTAAPSTKTLATSPTGGSAVFQWTANTRLNPAEWDSTATFTEVMAPGWLPGWTTASPPTCGVTRLTDAGTFTDFTVSLASSPAVPVTGDTVTFSFVADPAVRFTGALESADVVSCTIRNIPVATATVHKTSTVDSSLNLAGAVFQLQVGDGASPQAYTDVAGATCTTTAPTGSCVLSPLTVGASYRVVEVAAPANYALSSPGFQDVGPLTANGNVSLTFADAPIPVLPATVTVRKTSTLDSTLNLAGAVFKLQLGNGANPVVYADVPGATCTTTAPTGTCSLAPLTVGSSYRVVEVTAPANYTLSSPGFQNVGTLTPGGTVTLTFANAPVTTTPPTTPATTPPVTTTPPTTPPVTTTPATTKPATNSAAALPPAGKPTRVVLASTGATVVPVLGLGVTVLAAGCALMAAGLHRRRSH